ncbi:MAG: hypothetical protein HQK83_00925 [Fibrobacteria bacterium]|nr:hypothetical protein [Fibrobacteria bacterium]
MPAIGISTQWNTPTGCPFYLTNNLKKYSTIEDGIDVSTRLYQANLLYYTEVICERKKNLNWLNKTLVSNTGYVHLQGFDGKFGIQITIPILGDIVFEKIKKVSVKK